MSDHVGLTDGLTHAAEDIYPRSAYIYEGERILFCVGLAEEVTDALTHVA